MPADAFYTKSVVFQPANGERKKHFVIKYGPPASGKGTIEPLVCRLLGFDRYVDVNVDRYVSMLHTSDTPPDQKKYWELRKEADAISDRVLMDAQDNAEDIMWETTGNAEQKNGSNVEPLQWMVDGYIQPARQKGYTVVLVMPLVQTVLMSARCASRVQAADCELGSLRRKKKAASGNFPYIARYCDRVVVYDNNTKSPIPPLLLFDSSNANECGWPQKRLLQSKNANATEVETFITDRACTGVPVSGGAAAAAASPWINTGRTIRLREGVRTLYRSGRTLGIRTMRTGGDGRVFAAYISPPP